MQSAALMLAHIGERAAAEKLQGAVERVYAEGKHLTRDVGGTAGTAGVYRCGDRRHLPRGANLNRAASRVGCEKTQSAGGQ